jgi:hypothetical protein
LEELREVTRALSAITYITPKSTHKKDEGLTCWISSKRARAKNSPMSSPKKIEVELKMADVETLIKVVIITYMFDVIDERMARST